MFTVRDVNIAVLTELNKKSSPSFSREEFEYFMNKTALFVANEGFQFYAMNGRISDDYRFLKKNLKVTSFTINAKADSQDERTFLIDDNYFHMLSCEVYLNGLNASGETIVKRFQAKRLSDDAEGAVVDNVFLKPKYNVPYYDVDSSLNSTADEATVIIKTGVLPSGITFNSVETEYLKLPETIEVTDDDIYGSGDDNSQELEFPESLRNIYIARVSSSLLEYANNPRQQTLPPLSQDIPPVPVELMMAAAGRRNASQPNSKKQ